MMSVSYQHPKERFSLEALEARVLLSADGLAGLAGVVPSQSEESPVSAEVMWADEAGQQTETDGSEISYPSTETPAIDLFGELPAGDSLQFGLSSTDIPPDTVVPPDIVPDLGEAEADPELQNLTQETDGFHVSEESPILPDENGEVIIDQGGTLRKR